MTHALSRRAILAGLGCACCAGLVSPSPAHARVRPADMNALVGPGFRPTDEDERGLWQQYERFEEDIAGSNLLIRDPSLTSYLGGLMERVGGPAARDLRVYLAHVPEFNAFMAPTGFAVVFSGLLTRMRDEAQISGVIAHEAGHFLRRHHVRKWRDIRRRTDFLTVLSMGAGIGGAAAGTYLGNWVQLAGTATILTMAAYGRELEAEADAMGLRLIADTGYDPAAMPAVWQQLIGELDASAAMRRRHRRPQSLLATHPAPESRMRDLGVSAEEVKVVGRDYERGRERWLAAIGPHRQLLLDDQVKLNDPGASLYIIENLAADGWDGLLRYHEGEAWRLRGRPGDRERAERSYALAVAFADAPAEAWRAHGYALLRSGRRDEARAALARYLELAPEAADAAMVRYSLQQ